MSRYDGLIIPRSYNEYINKTDPIAIAQALQLNGVLSGAVAAGDNKAVKSSAVNTALNTLYNTKKRLINGTAGDYLTHWVKVLSITMGRIYDTMDLVFDINYHSLNRGGNIKGFLTAYTQTASSPFVIARTDKLLNNYKLKYEKIVNNDSSVTINLYCPTLTDNYIFYDINTVSNKDVVFNNFNIAADTTGFIDIDNEFVIQSNLIEYARIIKFSLGTNKSYSFNCTPLHLYRITMAHPSIENKKGLYTVIIQNSGMSKIENLLTENNYTVTMSGLTLTIQSNTNYGLGYIEDLGEYS